MSLGILVLCTQHDWYKAYAMICSLRLHNATIPVAVVAKRDVLNRFDNLDIEAVEEDPTLKGFAHKLILDQYSPYERTLFIDADMLWLCDPMEMIEVFKGMSYGARGKYISDTVSAFGLDRKETCRKLNVESMVNIEGAGHAYFEKPECYAIFERAREILNNYDEVAPGARVADEDIIAIVMTEFGIEPVNNKNIVGFYLAAKPETINLDITKGLCTYVDLVGDPVKPMVLHFPRDMTPWLYNRLMKKVIAHHNHKIKVPWTYYALRDCWNTLPLRYHLSQIKKALIKKPGSKSAS